LVVARLQRLALELLLEPQRLLASFEHRIALERLGLALRLLGERGGAALRALHPGAAELGADQEAQPKGHDGTDQDAAEHRQVWHVDLPDGAPATPGSVRYARTPRRHARVRPAPGHSRAPQCPGPWPLSLERDKSFGPGTRGRENSPPNTVCRWVLETWRARWASLRPGRLSRPSSRESARARAQRRRPPEHPAEKCWFKNSVASRARQGTTSPSRPSREACAYFGRPPCSISSSTAVRRAVRLLKSRRSRSSVSRRARSLNSSSAILRDARIATFESEATGSFSVISRIFRSTKAATSRMYSWLASPRIVYAWPKIST